MADDPFKFRPNTSNSISKSATGKSGGYSSPYDSLGSNPSSPIKSSKPPGFLDMLLGRNRRDVVDRNRERLQKNKYEQEAKKGDAEKAKKYFDSGMTKLKTIGPAIGPAFGKVSGAKTREDIGKGLGRMFDVRRADDGIKREKVREVYKALNDHNWQYFEKKDPKLAKTLRTDSGKRREFGQALGGLDPKIKG